MRALKLLFIQRERWFWITMAPFCVCSHILWFFPEMPKEQDYVMVSKVPSDVIRDLLLDRSSLPLRDLDGPIDTNSTIVTLGFIMTREHGNFLRLKHGTWIQTAPVSGRLTFGVDATAVTIHTNSSLLGYSGHGEWKIPTDITTNAPIRFEDNHFEASGIGFEVTTNVFVWDTNEVAGRTYSNCFTGASWLVPTNLSGVMSENPAPAKPINPSEFEPLTGFLEVKDTPQTYLTLKIDGSRPTIRFTNGLHETRLYKFTDAEWDILTNTYDGNLDVGTNTFSNFYFAGTNQWSKEHAIR